MKSYDVTISCAVCGREIIATMVSLGTPHQWIGGCICAACVPKPAEQAVQKPKDIPRFLDTKYRSVVDKLQAAIDGAHIIRESGIERDPKNYGKYACVIIDTRDITLCTSLRWAQQCAFQVGYRPTYIKLLTGY